MIRSAIKAALAGALVISASAAPAQSASALGSVKAVGPVANSRAGTQMEDENQLLLAGLPLLLLVAAAVVVAALVVVVTDDETVSA